MTIRLENVSKRAGAETHIDGVTIELAADAMNVLIGPTLSGKTSLMRLMAGLDQPNSGRIYVDDKDVTGFPVRKRDVAMVYQQFINYPNFNIFENIASPLRRAGMGRVEVDRKVRAAAEMMRIDDLLDRLPSELSGGQQQRTAIARALVKEAKLLLMDEPLVNLDYKLREGLRSEMRAVFEEARTVVVYATTEPLEALMLGGRTAVLHEGRLLQFGPTAEVYHRPNSITCAQNFSDPPMNVIPGRIENGTGVMSGDIHFRPASHMAGLADGEYRFGVRANHLAVQRMSERAVAVPGIVELAEVSGSETFIHVTHGETSCVVQEDGVHSMRIDEAVEIYVDPGNLFVFGPDEGLVAAPNHGGRSRHDG